MIEWLVLSTAFKAVVCSKTAELGSIPRRSRYKNELINLDWEKNNQHCEIKYNIFL